MTRIIFEEEENVEISRGEHPTLGRYVRIVVNGVEISVAGFGADAAKHLLNWRNAFDEAINFLETPEPPEDEVPPVEDESEYGDAREAEGEADEWYDQNHKSGDDGEA